MVTHKYSPRRAARAALQLALLSSLTAMPMKALQAQSNAAQRPAVATFPEQDTNYWKRAQEGYYWYMDPAPEAEPDPAKDPARELAAPDRAQADDLAAFEKFKADFERAMNAATQNPSEDNVSRFLELYGQARAKARTFSDAASTMSVRMPWLDPTFNGVRPTQPTAMRAFDMIAMQDRDQTLREMSQSYGLYFFFRGNCAYCHVEAPMLKQFSRKYGFTVFPVSLDGGTLPDFPAPAMDNGIALQVSSALGIPPQHFVVPAVVLARPAANQVVPVGFGAMTMDEMADRITSVVRVQQSGAGRPAASAVQALVGESGIGSGRPASYQGRAADQGFTLR